MKVVKSEVCRRRIGIEMDCHVVGYQKQYHHTIELGVNLCFQEWNVGDDGIWIGDIMVRMDRKRPDANM